MCSQISLFLDRAKSDLSVETPAAGRSPAVLDEIIYQLSNSERALKAHGYDIASHLIGVALEEIIYGGSVP